MQVQNQSLLKTCPFDEYLLMPGYSHSGLKNEGRAPIVATKKMRLGTLVHQYLCEPTVYNGEQSELVIPLGNALKKRIGILFHYLLPEFVVTADFVYNGFRLPFKGRIDLGIPKRLVIDIKVTEQPIEKGIQYFGYDNQVTGYAEGISAPVALIAAIHPKRNQVELKNVPLRYDWWHYQITQKGEPIL